MIKKRCPFCHESVNASEFAAHCKEHTRLRPDGQQKEYVTLPEEEREQGDISGVPSVYVHRVCGASTGMPEDIIRSYLKDPYLYGANRTFCWGCRKHVPHRECHWVETGEDLQSYFDGLRATKPRRKWWRWW